MTKATRKSFGINLIIVIVAALLALVTVMQAVYSPVGDGASDNDSMPADSMNGVSIKYTDAPNGLIDNDLKLVDKSINSTASKKPTPAPSKEVDVIVSLKGTPMMKYASDNGLTVAEALATADGKKNLQNLGHIRDNVLDEIGEYIIDRRSDYTAVINAFAATVRYGDIEAIESCAGVKNVILSETYLAPQAITENYVNVYGTGIFNSEGVGYDGTGTVVAVVDTGTDYTHEVFDMELAQDTLAIDKDRVAAVVPVLTATSTSALKNDAIDEDKLYLSSKLPYAYDYADGDTNVYPKESHGTHVAGIIAGKSQKITGVAPGAQIATFKVFSDYYTGAKTEWILAALCDAVALGVDAINMSLGTSCGFSREVDEANINEVYDAVNNAGICLVVAASNDASSAQASTWGNSNLATNPDSGTVGSPGSYNAALSVGSVSGVKTRYFMSEGKEIYFAESRLMGKTEPNDFVAGLLGDRSEGTFEYVVIPGVGLPVNYSGYDVSGKLAVVRRGTTSFEEKVSIAARNGAIGVIVYNNVSGTISMSVGTKPTIPSCFITMDLAKEIVARGTGTVKLSTSYLAGPFMSDFSSWGCLPNLILAPDITAHGGEIYSSVAGGNLYDKLSGTSMAAPNLAGALIIVREFVKSHSIGASTTAVRDESYSRMMSTATIVKNEQGNPYSPRKQGAGIADIASSVKTKAYLTVDGLNKPKLSLGDDPNRSGVYTLKFNIVNTANTAVSYNIGQYVMTESMSSDERTVAEKAYLFEDTTNKCSIRNKKGKASLVGDTVSVPGYGETEVTVKITLSAADKKYLDDLFENGMFVEGYVLLESNTLDGVDLNIPFLAFYGDWSKAPMLDVSAYEVGESLVDDSVVEEEKLKPDVYATLPFSGFYSAFNSDNMGYFGMGEFAYNLASGYTKPVTQEKFAALTTNSDGDYMLYGINAGLLRGAKRVDMEIRNSATGELIWSGVDYNARKSHSSGGEQSGGMVLIELDIRKLDLPGNSKYKFSMTCYLDWKGDNSYIGDYSDQKNKVSEYTYGNKNTYGFEFTVDNEAPTLTGAALRKEKTDNGYSYQLELNIHDNHYAQGYIVYTYEGKERSSDGSEYMVGYTSLTDGVVPVNGEFNANNLCNLNISAYWDLIKRNGGKLYVTMFDYAKNEKSVEVVIADSVEESTNPDAEITVLPKENLTIAKNRNVRDDYTIKKNEQINLGELITVRANVGTEENPILQEGYNTKDLIWEIVDVKPAEDTSTVPYDKAAIDLVRNGSSQGVVTGLIDGSRAIVRVRTPNVEEFDAADTAHCLQFEIIVSGEQAGGVKLSGIELSTTAIALERGESFTVKATVKPANYDGKVKLVWNSSNDQAVKIDVAEDGMSAVITALMIGNGKSNSYANIQANVEGSYISGYCSVGIKREYTITNNIYLRSYTGRGGDYVNERGEIERYVVNMPDDLGVAYIYPNAFYGNKYIRKVIIPEGITTIMRAAFMNCPNLEEVVLPKSLESIDYVAFANCSNLRKINLENVKSIGNSAFWGSALEEINLDKCTYIDTFAFNYCQKLKSIDLSRVGVVGGGAFAFCTSLENVVIPENTSLAYDSTYERENAGSIIAYRGGVFFGCSSLRSVIIKSKNVGVNAFTYCTALESVVFENDVELISDRAFAYCPNLKSVTFYGKAYKIGDYAFAACTSLESFKLPAGLTILGDAVFASSRVSKLVISSEATLDYVGATSLGGLNVEAFVVEDGNKYLSSDDGVLYDRAKLKLVAFPGAKNMDAVQGIFEVPETVKTIGQSAFANVKTLRGVDFGNVEYIESYAFMGSTGYYKQFVNYSKVRHIGDYAFSECAAINLPISNVLTHIGDYAFSGIYDFGSSSSAAAQYLISTINIPQTVRYIGDYAFGGLQIVRPNGLRDVLSLPIRTVNFAANSNVEYIGLGAFSRIPTLTTVDLGGLKALGNGMFAFCTSLASVTVPASVQSLGYNLFYGCSKLATVNLPAAVTANGVTSGIKTIPFGAFRDTALSKITLPDTVETIGDYAFENTKITAIDLKNVTYIGKYAFSGSQLSAVVSESETKAVTRIGAYAFNNCVKLVSAKFPYVAAVEANAFAGCSKLVTVVFSAAKEIGGSAFADCSELVEISLDKAEVIGANAFANAAKLESVNIPVVVSIGAQAFKGTAITELQLPKTLAKLEDKAFLGATNLAKIVVDEENATYVDMDEGVLYGKNGDGMYTLVCYPAGKSDVTTYDVFSHTVKLGAYAFCENKTLETVTLPSYMQIIGVSAMNGMSKLTSLTIYAASAPTLESYAYIVYPETDDSSNGGVNDDGSGDRIDAGVEYETELVKRAGGVYTNFYDNFSFKLENADKPQTLKIYIPYNSIGYDSYIWNSYVGKCLDSSAKKIYATLGTLDLIDRIQAELAKATHNASDVTRLQRVYGLLNAAQQSIVNGKYDYAEKDQDGAVVASVDAEYYNKLLKGVDFIGALNALTVSAAASSTVTSRQAVVASVGYVDSTVIAITAIIACFALVSIVTLGAKRRDR